MDLIAVQQIVDQELKTTRWKILDKICQEIFWVYFGFLDFWIGNFLIWKS